MNTSLFSRSPFFISMALVIGWLNLGVASSQAEPTAFLPDWNISGFNTYRADTYDASGALTGSPYPNLGFQQYDDFTLNMDRELSAYENMRVQISGTIDDSEYRSQKEGLIFERGYFTWEKADVAAPFRMEFGDFFGNQTSRTLQRSLKGAQVEIQPELFNGKHSIQLFSGITNVNYRELSDNKDIFSGASWLIPETALGAFALTTVNNITQADGTNPELSQTVYSLAWGKEAEYFQQNLEFEAEYALFKGDTGAGVTEQNKGDSGFFTQLKGRSINLPLTYRLRHERYGDDFQPNGSSITSNQRSTEGHTSWRFANGLSMRGRLQTFRTNWKSNNPTDRDVAGVTFSGTVMPSIQLNGSMGTFVSNTENQDGTVETLSHSSNASLSMPIAAHWIARLGGVYTESDNRVSGLSTISRQVSLGVDHDFDINGFRGSISPALNLRDRTSDNSITQIDISPAVSLFVRKDAHTLALSHNIQTLNARTTNGIDTDTYQSSLNYSYTHDAHRFEVIANYYDRNPSPGDDTEAYRVGVAWTFNFDRPARPILQQALETPSYDAIDTETVDPGAITTQPDMLDLAPGIDMNAVRTRLASAGIVDPVERSGFEIYETQLLTDIEHRQRLGLFYSANVLDQSALVIEFDELGDIDSSAQIYDEVRKVLLDRYGPPVNRVEEGAFTSNLNDDLRTGRFKRILEWQTTSGTLRFGIPYRTDGQIRMEVIHARSFPAGEDNFWSIEQFR